jgi:hypothetical protein
MARPPLNKKPATKHLEHKLCAKNQTRDEFCGDLQHPEIAGRYKPASRRLAT